MRALGVPGMSVTFNGASRAEALLEQPEASEQLIREVCFIQMSSRCYPELKGAPAARGAHTCLAFVIDGKPSLSRTRKLRPNWILVHDITHARRTLAVFAPALQAAAALQRAYLVCLSL